VDACRHLTYEDSPVLLNVAWSKLLTVVLWKHRDVLPPEIVITPDDVAEMAADPVKHVLADGRPDGVHLRLASDAEMNLLNPFPIGDDR
jgi:hypothetical protein